jgi:hypothetical protein
VGRGNVRYCGCRRGEEKGRGKLGEGVGREGSPHILRYLLKNAND